MDSCRQQIRLICFMEKYITLYCPSIFLLFIFTHFLRINIKTVNSLFSLKLASISCLFSGKYGNIIYLNSDFGVLEIHSSLIMELVSLYLTNVIPFNPLQKNVIFSPPNCFSRDRIFFLTCMFKKNLTNTHGKGALPWYNKNGKHNLSQLTHIINKCSSICFASGLITSTSLEI